MIRQGAERLGWTLEELMEKTILAMRSCEEAVAGETEALIPAQAEQPGSGWWRC